MSNIYKLTDKARSMKWKDWKKMGGCGLSDQSARCVVQKLGLPISAWGGHTLGQLDEAHIVVGRELARYAATEEKEGNRRFAGLGERDDHLGRRPLGL